MHSSWQDRPRIGRHQYTPLSTSACRGQMIWLALGSSYFRQISQLYPQFFPPSPKTPPRKTWHKSNSKDSPYFTSSYSSYCRLFGRVKLFERKGGFHKWDRGSRESLLCSNYRCCTRGNESLNQQREFVTRGNSICWRCISLDVPMCDFVLRANQSRHDVPHNGSLTQRTDFLAARQVLVRTSTSSCSVTRLCTYTILRTNEVKIFSLTTSIENCLMEAT